MEAGTVSRENTMAFVLVNLGERFGSENGVESYRGVGEERVMIDLRLTHRDLAYIVASTRESVSKRMGEFRSRGLLEITRGKKVLLQNPAALLEYAGAR